MTTNQITDISGFFTLRNGVKMPYLGLGVYLSKDGQEVTNAVHWALEAGYRHIDTAAIYRNEKGVGEGIKTSNVSRKDIFVVNKVWNSDQGYEKTLKAFDKSLKQLQLDYIDLYLVHWPVTGQYKDTWRALEELYRQKKVRAIGVSNFLKHQLEDLMESATIIPMVNQMEFHPYLVQQELIDFCQQHQIQYEAWSPLMQGKVFDLPELQLLANKYNKCIAQIVLRYNLQKGIACIPKSSKRKRIISNADIFDFELSEADTTYLDDMDRNHRFGPNPDNFEWSYVL
ncbi:aldo/keto reductase [Tamlana sp. s12]|uniref:aldo/keto reductase n=1 Tax=Tamlana sp. s12 TaxID=1630406 RepID=UPI0007FD3721|nr:aldo/keto reductase [Tamlana sp. s12]OBQ54118.1 glyoxal reductase [Tamlana sp. s12]QQY81370.1 aldo/keto reductase [Tamlana sp. s12]